MQERSAWSWALAAMVLTLGGCGESTTLSPDGGGASMDGGSLSGEDGSTTDAGPIAAQDGSLPEADGGAEPGLDAGMTPDAGAPEACTSPGMLERVACGMCGTVERFCTAAGTWAYGTCSGEGGACMPGSTESAACGMCGTQTRRCTDACAWEATGSCTGEGVCAPGATTRSSAGCAAGQTRGLACSDACVFEPVSECIADGCPTPGTLDREPCGMCGTRERFCNAMRVWEYGACGGEGVCMPGTTGASACGMCGTQASRCTDTCTWIPSGTCSGEGSCTPGTTTRTSAGCPAGQTHLLRCSAACGYTEEVEACTASRPVDVTLVLDSTGSNETSLAADLPTIASRCVGPLLALRDVQVGVSYAGEYPVSPYGSAGTFGGGADRPFEGGIEPGTSAMALSTEVAGRPRFSGGDAQDALVEALSSLMGGPLATSSRALSCSPGRTDGGCWRTGAQRVFVVHTDSPIHNGPDPASTGLLVPYVGITPAPATWPELRTRMGGGGATLLLIDSGSTSPAPAQFDEMLTDLGQPLSDRHVAEGATAVGTACDAIVARVRTLAGL